MFKRIINKILVTLGMVKPVNECDIEYLRSQGVTIGENVDIINSQDRWRTWIPYINRK